MSVADLVKEARRETDQARTENLLLRASCEARRIALIEAREKLKIYRAERQSSEYTGGMEYVMLMRLIDEAIGP